MANLISVKVQFDNFAPFLIHSKEFDNRSVLYGSAFLNMQYGFKLFNTYNIFNINIIIQAFIVSVKM